MWDLDDFYLSVHMCLPGMIQGVLDELLHTREGAYILFVCECMQVCEETKKHNKWPQEVKKVQYRPQEVLADLTGATREAWAT
jgi:hypothetical protein